MPKYQTSSNEIEKKIVAMYSRGMTTRDIADQLEDMYGMKLSAGLISQITEKVLPMVEEWQNRPLESVYPIVYLDAIHMKIRIDGKTEARAVYHCLGMDLEDKKEFMADLKLVYKAPTKSAAETALDDLESKWKDKYLPSVRKWREDWDNLTQYFEYPAEIRLIIYTTNIIEGYHRQIRKATKTKAVFPDQRSAAKMLYLATDNVRKKWTKPIQHWPNILNQLAIRFEGRLPL